METQLMYRWHVSILTQLCHLQLYKHEDSQSSPFATKATNVKTSLVQDK